MLKTSPINLETIPVTFKTLVRERKLEVYTDLATKFNQLFEDRRNLQEEVRTLNEIKNQFTSLRDQINPILRKMECPDRLDRPIEMGTILSNILWRLHVHRSHK